ncbi:MAG: hypothetical protein K6G71_06765, partial [Clostridiales bacterium]|nr:hypothetical protein [Clostridiales bacterium]
INDLKCQRRSVNFLRLFDAVDHPGARKNPARRLNRARKTRLRVKTAAGTAAAQVSVAFFDTI